MGDQFDNKAGRQSRSGEPATPKKQPRFPAYFCDNQVVEIARDSVRRAQGNYEIADVNRAYLEQGRLHVRCYRGTAWLDTGTVDQMTDAADYAEPSGSAGPA